jgi:hypothetical protein
MMGRPDLRDIVARLGGDLYNGGTAANVPGPGHSRRDRSLSLRLTPQGRILYYAFAPAEHADVWKHLGLDDGALRPMSGSEAARARQERARERRAADERRMAFCSRVWRSTAAPYETPVEVYLRGRGIAGPIPVSLRYTPAAPLGYEPGAPAAPAMVALAHDPAGRVAGLHVTFLLADGSDKARMERPRRMFWRLDGGAVRLGELPPYGGVLAVAEGIETALSFRDLTGVTTWAAGSAGALSRFQPPAGLSRLVIAADADDDGQGLAAAHELARRAGRRMDVAISAAPAGKDWNTVAMEGGL